MIVSRDMFRIASSNIGTKVRVVTSARFARTVVVDKGQVLPDVRI